MQHQQVIGIQVRGRYHPQFDMVAHYATADKYSRALDVAHDIGRDNPAAGIAAYEVIKQHALATNRTWAAEAAASRAVRLLKKLR